MSFGHRIPFRGRMSREPSVPCFIYLEGESEATYFDRNRRLYSIGGCKIKIQKESNVLDVLDSCIEEKRRLDRSLEHRTFMILDADNQSERDIIRATEIAREQGITMILSNLSFEVWLIMHFEKPSRVYTQKDYEERIRDLTGHTYRKSEGIGQFITKESVLKAIKISRGILDSNEPIDCKRKNESTMLHIVLEELRLFDVLGGKVGIKPHLFP